MSQQPFSPQNFNAVHGHCVADPKVPISYYSDGARREGAFAQVGYYEPPEDPRERQELIVKYWRLRKDAADESFITLKNRLLFDTTVGSQGGRVAPPPPKAELERLVTLRDDCRAINRMYTEAEKELRRLAEAVNPKGRAIDALLAQRNKEFKDSVLEVEV